MSSRTLPSISVTPLREKNANVRSEVSTSNWLRDADESYRAFPTGQKHREQYAHERQGAGSDSGALLCSGYYAQPALAEPYIAGTSKSIFDAYTCATLGILQGRANQGVGPTEVLPTVFTLIQDILASLSLEPLIR